MKIEHLDQIAKMVSKFLKENGGYSNGYDTAMDHVFTQRSHSSANWSTPSSENLTGKEKRKLGYEFSEKVLKYMEENAIWESIKVYSAHTEHGAFRIYVTFIPAPIEVSLN